VIILSSPVIDIHKRLHLSDFGSIDLTTPLPSQTTSYIAEDMRIINSAAYTQELAELISQLVLKKRKNMVVIVSNFRLLDQIVTPLSSRMKEENIPYLAQKISGGEYKVLEMYARMKEQCILFCTPDFLQKIPARTITADVFVLQKLPFAYTNGIIDTIRKQKYRNSFMEYALPKSLYRFEELIGTIEKVGRDNKKIIILDNKMVTEQYGQYFRQLLPDSDQILMVQKKEILSIL
jgi:ATP-dependent DNA helicase DinG